MKMGNEKIGLSLSGGGYRAAAFHLGTLRYLNSHGILDKVNYLSTVSGGSIIGASYCHKVKSGATFEEFDAYFSAKLQESIIGKVLGSWPFIRLMLLIFGILLSVGYFAFFTCHAWVAIIVGIMGLALIVRYQFRLFPSSQIIEKIYDKLFFESSVLSELPAKPKLIINSTNLQTGRLFYFTRDKMSDSTYDGSYSSTVKSVFKHERFPLAKAVMCSSAIPSAFTPVKISSEFFEDPEDIKKITPILIDGGVYDNQGIHKLTHPNGDFECQLLVVSDAGNRLPFEGAYNNVLTLLLRTVELFMNRIKMFQMMINLYRGLNSNQRQIAYVSLGWDLDNLVPGFVQNVRDGHVNQTILDYFDLTSEVLRTSSNETLVDRVSSKINLKEILTRKPTNEQVRLARSVSTNLTGLSQAKIGALSTFAEVMTEIQVKLYAPALLN